MAQYRTVQNDMLDAICHRHYGTPTGTVEAVLAANPGLASHGAILPAGLLVELPDNVQPQQQSITPTVRLYD